MSQYQWHVDTFTTLDSLTTKQRRDPDVVLAALRNVSRISCWDMDTGKLWVAVKDLECQGKIALDTETIGYPWIGVRVLAPEVRAHA